MAELLPPPPAGSSAAAMDAGAAAQPVEQPPPAQSMAPPPMPDPGSWNLLHAEKDGVLSVQRMFWEGAKVVYNRGLSNVFQVAHTFTLTPEGDKANNYTFAPVYVGMRDSADGKGPAEQSMVVQGELGVDGSEMAQLILGPNDPLSVVLVGQTKGKQWVYSQGSASYSGKGWSSSLMFVKQPMQAATIYVSDYLRKWGERLTIGAQFMAHTSDVPQPGVPSVAPMVSLAARWREKEWVATATAGVMDGSMQASYYHYIPPIQGSGTTLAACDFVWNPQVTGKPYPIAKIGFQANFRSAIFKTQLTSEGEIASSLDQEIFPPLMLNVNGALDHHTGIFKCGLGLTFNS